MFEGRGTDPKKALIRLVFRILKSVYHARMDDVGHGRNDRSKMGAQADDFDLRHTH